MGVTEADVVDNIFDEGEQLRGERMDEEGDVATTSGVNTDNAPRSLAKASMIEGSVDISESTLPGVISDCVVLVIIDL